MPMRYCDKCCLHETDLDETLYSCDCVKGKTYDLDRALSQIEEFFNEDNFRGYNNNSLAGVGSKDNSTRGRD